MREPSGWSSAHPPASSISSLPFRSKAPHDQDTEQPSLTRRDLARDIEEGIERHTLVLGLLESMPRPEPPNLFGNSVKVPGVRQERMRGHGRKMLGCSRRRETDLRRVVFNIRRLLPIPARDVAPSSMPPGSVATIPPRFRRGMELVRRWRPCGRLAPESASPQANRTGLSGSISGRPTVEQTQEPRPSKFGAFPSAVTHLATHLRLRRIGCR